jgi:hypothetical protein
VAVCSKISLGSFFNVIHSFIIHLWFHSPLLDPGRFFEPMIPAFERVKTVQVLDREATVIGPSSM